jgi:hypothetical protein
MFFALDGLALLAIHTGIRLGRFAWRSMRDILASRRRI